MRFFCFLLMLTGCVSKREPQINDTKFDPNERNWLNVYDHELKTAIDNDDGEAYYFFWPEYLKEYDKQRGKAGVIKK